VLAVLPLAWVMRGAPMGEPVAEDFDFLHRTLFTGIGSLFDGGGSQAFWRPIPHQLYYAAVGPLLLAHPMLVAILHLGLLALGALLLYRALRPAWSGGRAAAAASFPLLAESTRTLAGWPTQFVDLGLFLFAALALHEASRRRLVTALAALLGALLCKEPAIVLALALPFVPSPARWERRERLRWAAAAGTLALAWALAYLGVRAHAHLELPHGVEHDPTVLATPFAERVAWAAGASLKAIASLTRVPGPHDRAALAMALALAGAAAMRLAASQAARERLARGRTWIGFGLAWFALATLALTPIFPMWQPNRSQFGSIGLGIAAVGVLGAAHPALVPAMVVARLGLLALAPGAARSVGAEAPATGAFMDFERLTRLQRFMRETRAALRERRGGLPPGSRVVQQNLPHALEYALGGDRALQAWYRDPSLRWLRFDEFRARPQLEVAAVVQYEPGARREVVLVDVSATRLQLAAQDLLHADRWQDAIDVLDRADRLEPNPDARVFHLTGHNGRALGLGMLGRHLEAEREARLGIALVPGDPNARYGLALALADQRRWDEAGAALDSLFAIAPNDADGLELARLIAGRGAPATREP
jgi:tetratricopeptide (TPR) repeat protein